MGDARPSTADQRFDERDTMFARMARRVGTPAFKWPTNVERCYAYWRSEGTDCGICMAVCPFSHRDNVFHGLVRGMVRRAARTHRAARWFDDRVYGRRWNPAGGAGVQET